MSIQDCKNVILSYPTIQQFNPEEFIYLSSTSPQPPKFQNTSSLKCKVKRTFEVAAPLTRLILKFTCLSRSVCLPIFAHLFDWRNSPINLILCWLGHWGKVQSRVKEESHWLFLLLTLPTFRVFTYFLALRHMTINCWHMTYYSWHIKRPMTLQLWHMIYSIWLMTIWLMRYYKL